MKVLVTGAGGFVGQAVTTCLANSGVGVRALVRSSDGIFMGHENVEWILGDLRDTDALARALEGVDRVVHLAAAKSDEPSSYATNVDGTRALAEIARIKKIDGFVLLSTISAKFKKRGVYGETKLLAEKSLEESSVPAVILRSSVIYGEVGEGIMGTILGYTRLPLVPVLGPGTPTIYPIHVEDVALAIREVLSRPMEDRVTYDLGGPTGITLDGLTRLLAEKVRGKKHIWLIHIPIWFGFLVAYLGKISGVRLLTESNVLGASQHASVEHEAFDAKYGFTARPLAQGIADMLRHAAKTSKESYVLLSYLSGKKTSDYYARLYDKAVTRYLPSSLPVPNSILSNHSQLAALDAHTRVRSVNGSFQKKMLIAAALYETSPRSQELLREYSIFSMFRFFLSAGFTSVWFFAIGLFRLPPEARPFLHE